MDPIDPEEAARRKKSFMLLAGGAASLVLPLLGILYMRWNESRGIAKQAATTEVFEQREGERRIVPAGAPAMAAAVALGAPAQSPSAPPPGVMAPLPSGGRGAQAGGSLGFIKPSDDYFKDKPAEASAPKKEEPAAPPAPAARKAAPAKPAKTGKTKSGKKTFVMPKLNTTKGFTNFKRNQQEAPAEAAGEEADMSELLQNLPPGAADNPELQKYLNQNK